MNSKYINNNSQTLIILFQSAGRLPLDIFQKIKENSISEAEVKEFHENYNWMKFALENKKFDYLFVQDYYSNSYGWYLFDHGSYIYNSLNKELTNYTKRYKNVYAFGSSKGGSAALIYGYLNKYITHVFALVPQIKIAKYINTHFNDYKELFFNEDKEFEKEVDAFICELFSKKNFFGKCKTKFYIYTGIKDEQFEELMEFKNISLKQNYNLNFIINRLRDRHTPLVLKNKDYLLDILSNLDSEEYIKNGLFRIDDNVSLL